MLDIPIEDLISVLFIMIAVILTMMIAIKSFKSYKANKAALTVIIAVSTLFVSLAMIFLTAEKALFTEAFFNGEIGMLCGGIAIVFSGAAVLSFCLFAYEMAFPRNTKTLGILSALPIAFYVIIWLTDNSKYVTGVLPSDLHEIGFGFMFGIDQFTPMLAYFTLVPLFSVPIIILFYYALKVRKESGLKSKRAAGLGFGGLALASAYIMEIIGLDPISPTIIIIIVAFRFLFIVAGAFFYWALFKLKSKEQ